LLGAAGRGTSGGPAAGSGGATTGGMSGSSSGGVPSDGTSGASAVGGNAGGGTGGNAGDGTSENAGTTTGGNGAGGVSGAPGGAGGTIVQGGTGGMPLPEPLDCGGNAMVIENGGPPSNRVNFVILGDGYSAAELDTLYPMHVRTYTTKRFSDPIGQPYLRYRKFVNICAIKIPSTPICGSSALGCCGDDTSRLATCNAEAANRAFTENLPASLEIDWRAVVLNGSSWWNTGSALMLWSGGNGDAAGGALHEGGHAFHQLGDEYGDCSGGRRVNGHTEGGMTGGKWDQWVGYTQTPGTGLQDFYPCEGNDWRSTENSMMNSLFGNDPNTSFNAVSREKIIMDIWRLITSPWDSVDPPPGAVTSPTELTLNLIDPAVISVDWTVDGVVTTTGGPTFDVAAANLASGTHVVSARAYDNAGMDLIRAKTGTDYHRRYWASNAQKTVSWTVTIGASGGAGSDGGLAGSGGTAGSGGSNAGGSGGDLCGTRTGGALMDWTIAGEPVRLWFTNQAFIDEMETYVGGEIPRQPVLDLVDGQDCNSRWTWHVDPENVSFRTTRLGACSSWPSSVEADKETWLGLDWCPEQVKVIAVRRQ